jgi:hypothetical protein
MAALAAANGLAAGVLIAAAVATSGALIPVLVVAAFAAVIAMWLAISSVTVTPDALILQNGPRTRVVPRSQIDKIGVTTISRTRLLTVGITLAGSNVGVSCLQRLPTRASRAAIGNQVLVLLTGQLAGDRRVHWTTDAVADDAWHTLERLILLAHAGDIDQFTVVARSTGDQPALTLQRVSIYVTVGLADVVGERIGPVRDAAVLARLSTQIQQRYAQLIPEQGPDLDQVLATSTNESRTVLREAGSLLVEAGAAAIGCLLGDFPHTELDRLRTRISGWLLMHANELPAHLLIPTRVYAD